MKWMIVSGFLCAFFGSIGYTLHRKFDYPSIEVWFMGGMFFMAVVFIIVVAYWIKFG